MESVQKFFKLNLIIMRILGFYPPRKFKQLYKLYRYAVYTCFTIPVPTLAVVYLIVGDNITMTQLSDSLFVIFQVGGFIFKLIPFIFNVDGVRETIHMMEWPVFNNYTKNQENIIQECSKVCKRNTWLFFGSCVVAMFTWATTPFFGSSHIFPIEVWLPFEVKTGTKRYIFLFVFMVIGVGDGALANGVIDPLVSGMAYFAATQIRILKDNLQHLGAYAEAELGTNLEQNESRDDQKHKMIYSLIRNCADHHNAILKFIERYESVYSSVAFTQFVSSVLVICLSCLQLSMVEPMTFTFFSVITFLLTMLLEVFLYCYLGSILIEESNTLTTAVYMGTWYEYDLKCRKALIVLMERSKRPIIVTAGKILELSLVTFTTILRRAYSLLAILQNYK